MLFHVASDERRFFARVANDYTHIRLALLLLRGFNLAVDDMNNNMQAGGLTDSLNMCVLV